MGARTAGSNDAGNVNRGRTVDHFGVDFGAKIANTGGMGIFGERTKIGGGVAGTTTAISAAGNATASSARRARIPSRRVRSSRTRCSIVSKVKDGG